VLCSLTRAHPDRCLVSYYLKRFKKELSPSPYLAEMLLESIAEDHHAGRRHAISYIRRTHETFIQLLLMVIALAILRKSLSDIV